MLIELLTQHRGLAADIARGTGLSRPYVWQCAAGNRAWPLRVIPAIERATDGRVTVEQLRGDIRWHRIPDPTWPHPEGRPAIDVAGPAQQEARDAA